MWKKLPKLVSGFCLGCLAATSAQGNPQGPQVAAGSAGFANPAPNVLEITNTPGAIINWQAFGIDSNEVTRFLQQSNASAVLNRVVGQDPSAVLGQLMSNGRVFLINHNGIVFGPNAVVDTAGLIASTLNMTDEDFLAGDYRFSGDEGSGNITNQGLIKTGADGEVFLIAPSIDNSGIIQSDGGDLVLAAGRSVRLTSLDTAGVTFEVQAPENEVINLGQLLSRGGAAAIFAGTLHHSGDINVDAVTMDPSGQIRLVAQSDAIVTGTVSARGADNPLSLGESGSGGSIQILGNRVGLFEGATVDASGPGGGGEVLVGGDFQGNNPAIQNSTHTVLGSDANITADATDNGDGGRVIVWADDFTGAYGSVSVRGGHAGGNGGFIEISGKEHLEFEATVNSSAPVGAAGTVLLDPKDIEIINGGTQPNLVGIPTDGDPNTFAFTESPATSFTGASGIDASVVIAILSGGSPVVLQANNDITISQQIVNLAGGPSGGALTLSAGRSVLINADINTDDELLTIIANATVASDRDAGAAAIIMADGTTLNAGTNTIDIDLNASGAQQSGNIVLENLMSTNATGGVTVLHDGTTSGSSILRTSADALITTPNAHIELENASNGTIGTAAAPLRLTGSGANINVESHIHQTTASTDGIFFDIIGNGTIGNVPIALFGGGVRGVQTQRGGQIVITSTGVLTLNAGGLGFPGGPVRTATISGTGDLTLRADNMALNNLVVANGANVVIDTFGTDIDVGGADVGGGSPVLGLTTAELGQITGSMITIGDATSMGTLSVTAALASANINASTLQLEKQNIIIQNAIDFSGDSEDLIVRGTGTIEIINNLLGGNMNLSLHDLTVDGLGTAAFESQGGPAANQSLGVNASNNVSITNVASALWEGGAGASAASNFAAGGSLTVNATGGFRVLGHPTASGSGIQISSVNGMTVTALFAEIIGGIDGFVMLDNNGGTLPQVFNTTGSSAGITFDVRAPLAGNVSITNQNSGGQALNITNGNVLRVHGQVGSVAVNSFSGPQSISMTGSGTNRAEFGTATATGQSTMDNVGGAQTTVTLDELILDAGAGATSLSFIRGSAATALPLTITAANGIQMTGASAGDNVDAALVSRSGIAILVGGPLGLRLNGGSNAVSGAGNRATIQQTTTTGGINITLNNGPPVIMTAGNGVDNNDAVISSVGGDINIMQGVGAPASVTLMGGGGTASDNNSAEIEAQNPAGNDINITIAGDLTLSGSTEPTATDGFAEIISSLGNVTANIGGNAVLTGGPGAMSEATLDAELTVDFDGNSLTLNSGAGAESIASFGGTTIQIDTIGALSVTGGSGLNAIAGFGSDDTSIAVTVNSGGNVSFTGGSDPGGTAIAGILTTTGCSPAPCNANIVVNSDASVILQSGATAGAALGSFSTPIGTGPIVITAANGGSGNIQLNDATLQTNGPITLSVAGGTGTITQATAGTIAAGTNQLNANTTGGAVQLQSLTNVYGDFNSVTMGGAVTLDKASNLNILGINTGAGAITLNVTGQITQTGGVVTSGMLTSTSTGALNLNSTSNNIALIQADVTTSGDLTLRTSTPVVQVTGTGLSSPGRVDINVTGSPGTLFLSQPITAGADVDIQAPRVNANNAITTPGNIILNSVSGILQIAGPLRTTGPSRRHHAHGRQHAAKYQR